MPKLCQRQFFKTTTTPAACVIQVRMHFMLARQIRKPYTGFRDIPAQILKLYEKLA